MTWLSVDLPEPFGPMMACTSPLFTVRESPWRISRSSTRTCRFLTSSSGITFFHFFLVLRSAEGASRRTGPTIFFSHPSSRPPRALVRLAATRPPQDESLSDRAFQRDRDQLLRLDRELHRQLLQHVLYKAIDHKTDGLFLPQPAPRAIKTHILGNLRGGRFVLEQRGGILRFDIGHGVRAAFVADQERVAGRKIARAGRLAVRGYEAAIGVLGNTGRDALGDDPAGGVLAEMDHLGAGIDLLVAVRNRDRIEFAARIIAAQDAARIFPGDRRAGLDLGPGNLRIVAAAIATLGDEIVDAALAFG